MNADVKKKLELRTSLDSIVDVTFYIPCSNEEENIIPTLEKLVRTVTPMHISFELLIYDDGSTDATLRKLRGYEKKHPELLIHIIHNDERKGLGYNYIDGAFIGVGKYYMMICGDNSETEESIRAMLEKMGKADIIIPYFGSLDTRTFHRRYLSRVFTFLVNMLNGYSIHYYNGIVLHKRSNIVRWNPGSSGFAYQAELISILLDKGHTYIEIQISNKDRKSGISKAFNFRNYLSVTHSLLQILFRRIRKYVYAH